MFVFQAFVSFRGLRHFVVVDVVVVVVAVLVVVVVAVFVVVDVAVFVVVDVANFIPVVDVVAKLIVIALIVDFVGFII